MITHYYTPKIVNSSSLTPMEATAIKQSGTTTTDSINIRLGRMLFFKFTIIKFNLIA